MLDEHEFVTEMRQAMARAVERKCKELNAADLIPEADPDQMSVDECPACDGGHLVRYCPLHGLNGTHPR